MGVKSGDAQAYASEPEQGHGAGVGAAPGAAFARVALSGMRAADSGSPKDG